MATYYVRKTGSDTNNGTSPATAWATIAKALGSGSPVTGGDIVYIGAGVYAEAVTVAITPTTEVRVVGDVTGRYTGDGGEVRITRYTSGDNAAINSGSAALLNLSGKSNITLENITFEGYTNANGTCLDLTGSVSTIKAVNCTFYGSSASTSPLVAVGSNTVSVTYNVTFDRCLFISAARTNTPCLRVAAACRSTGGDFDLGILCTNCVFTGGNLISYSIGSTTNTGKPGGVIFRHCLIDCAPGTIDTNFATTIPQSYIDCIFGMNASTPGSNQMSNPLHAYNIWCFATKNASTNALGSGTDQDIADKRTILEPLFAGLDRHKRGPHRAVRLNSEQRYTGGHQASTRTSGTQANDTTVGTVAWSDMGNVNASDNTYAVATSIPASTGISNYLKLTNFGFNVPTDATITDVFVVIERKASVLSAIRDNSIRLVVGGTITGNDLATTNFWGTSDGYANYGGSPSSVWGVSLSPSDVNSTTFGVVISAKNTHASNAADASIDLVTVTVVYQLAAGHTNQLTVDFTGRPRPTSLRPTIGPFDVHDHGVIQSTVSRSGSALQLTGPGDHEFLVPVTSGSTTVSVYARYDTAHGTTAKPQLQVYGDQVGVDLQTATMTAAADTWEQLSITVNPTKSGLLTVRLVCRAASATGNAYFDDLSVN